MKIHNDIKTQPLFAVLCNLGLMVVVYYLCRIAFFGVNKSYFSEINLQHFLTLLKGGFQFDVSAIMYTNLLYVLMQVVPFKFRLTPLYQTIARWIFVVSNSIAVIANCCDFAYFPFINRRTTCTVFAEFKNENNIALIVGNSLIDYWYVTLFAGLLIFAIYKLYYRPIGGDTVGAGRALPLRRDVFYYLRHSVLMACFVYLSIAGMRGGFGPSTRPIAINNANQYTNKSIEAAIVLNTPFSLIRTTNRTVYRNPNYFKDEAEMAAVYSPIHYPMPQGEFKPLNVVLIILESFGKEYSGFFNKELDNGNYKGYTPFLDSLYATGLTFKYSYTNGRSSIDALPSVFSSIPMFVESFIVSSYVNNGISSIPDVLKEKGYYSAFFHGAYNGSMGFQPFTKAAKFDDYFGLEDYPNGDKDYDGTWAIWDEEFLQFYADKMGTMAQPFVTSIFTTTSHNPFNIPSRYNGKFPEGTKPIHKCIGYTDNALRQFFKRMAQYEWFENTLFVITADHTNQTTHDEYFTDVNLYAVPVLFYQPGSELRGVVDTLVVQQIDIMPTVLDYLNYDKPYFAFGQNILNTPMKDKFVANYNNSRYQLLKNDYFLQFDGQKTNAVYDYKSDPLLRDNLAGKVPEQPEMETLLKAIIQQYLVRMSENRLEWVP
ncbi:LTA synthase family protein [Candidatus Symbiothrix dinenymphae]|uniref:LTA synthase family protein n=1 Tax=Candidatus Symbiothrix dinenymphae TaxID=467085 RepID=UPI0006C462F4|nr:sulfatase-like hydrolase/transferase [Candidatus Symbiothrix dinenymphae]GAP72746.1 sulfatase [Candidatus Symbiothrix dinenymphae]